MATTQLTRTLSGNGNGQIFTLSCWLKRSKINDYGQIFSTGTGISDGFNFGFNNSNQLIFESWDGSTNPKIKTNRLFRDVSAFYHLVLAVDTTQGTASNRVKIYVNGVQETSFAQATYPSQNYTFPGTNQISDIARVGYTTLSGSWTYFDGSMSHVHWIDGTAYDASAFGETDATTGEWKGKTSPSVTYGTNGFFILKDGNGITDQSGEGNDFTLGGGTLTDLKDNPDNVFATLNPLYKPYASATFSEGNLKISTATGWSGNKATMGVSQGKWYWEIKLSGAMTDHQHGVQQENVNEGVSNPENTIGTTVFFNQDGGEMKTNGTATTADYGLFSTGDIMGVALDMDSGSYGQITIYKNGTPLVSNFNLSSSSTLVMPFSSIVNSTAEYNFGNGYFGTTAVTTNSGNGYSGAEGSSKFNYTVPAGYSALSTKGLNE